MSESPIGFPKDEIHLKPLLSNRAKQRWKSRQILNTFIAIFAGLVFYHYFRVGGFCIQYLNLQTPPPMDVFEVYPPVRVSKGYLPTLEGGESPECKVLLMQHVFGWSYGKPFVGAYTPPPCEWTHVLFNLTMTSAGRQFDRLAVIFLGDIEVFRTSTAEPTWYGIEFNYVKDMTAYSSLLGQEQKVIFDLGNLVDDNYTGLFNATLTATFYTPPVTTSMPVEGFLSPANIIFPISQRNSARNQPSLYHLPKDHVKDTILFPPNTIRATVSISASGNAAEEFWYTNVPTDFTETFGANAENLLPGYSPFREIQLLVDGEILGAAWPFATIFTGGINPGLWRPIVGIAAFDIPEYEIDISPFLPVLLTHRKPAVFEIKVVGWDPNPAQAEKIGTDWLVSGRVFIWTDPHDTNWTTTGTIHKRSFRPPTFKLTTTLETDTKGAKNTSLELQLTAHRFLSMTSTIFTSSGPRVVSWTQGLSYSNTNILTANGTNQTVKQLTQGTIASTGTQALTFRWPLTIKTSFKVDEEHGNFTIYADIDRAVEETAGHGRGSVFAKGPGTLHTRQSGNAVFASGQYAKGITEQEMTFVGVPTDGEGVGVYRRLVKAEGGKLVEDEEIINGRVVEKAPRVKEDVARAAMSTGKSIRRILGRGPG